MSSNPSALIFRKKCIRRWLCIVNNTLLGKWLCRFAWEILYHGDELLLVNLVVLGV